MAGRLPLGLEDGTAPAAVEGCAVEPVGNGIWVGCAIAAEAPTSKALPAIDAFRLRAEAVVFMAKLQPVKRMKCALGPSHNEFTTSIAGSRFTSLA